MKKILSILSVASLLLSGCLKDDRINEYSNLGQTIELPGHGLANFSGDAVIAAGQTDPMVFKIVTYVSSENPPSSNVNYTLGLDDTKRTAYNSSGAGLIYELAPDSIYSFPVKSGVIPAGSRSHELSITFFPDKVDPSKTYMLPIVIKDGGGVKVSGNLSTVYYHLIGNPLAGSYLWDFYRWNIATPTGAPGTTWVGEPITLLPVSPTIVEAPSGYFIQPRYRLEFTNTGGVLSNFSVTINAADNADLIANGVTVTDGPNIQIANPVTKRFRFQYQVFNGTAFRYLIDEYYK
jgi:hypothetical protein